MKIERLGQGDQVKLAAAEDLFDGPMNPDAVPLVKAEVRKDLPTESENLKRSIALNNEWWAANEAALIDRWNKWLLQK